MNSTHYRRPRDFARRNASDGGGDLTAAALRALVDLLRAFASAAPSAPSIKLRIASDRVGRGSGWVAIQASRRSIISGGARNDAIGSVPVAGRPLFFGMTAIDFGINPSYGNSAGPARSLTTKPALTTERC
jgi:hypothetical protein